MSSVLAAALILAGFGLTQAQVTTKGKPAKPPKEPEAAWAVRIPTPGQGFMFYGDGEDGYYGNNGTNIQASVVKGDPGAWGKYYDFVYSFSFKLANDNVGIGPSRHVGFQNVAGLYDTAYPNEGKPCCRFPGDPCGSGNCLSPSCSPDCLAAFLNGTHPHQDYEYFDMIVDIFDQDIELMLPGDSYIFGSASDPGEPGDNFCMVAHFISGCYADPAYHDVEIARNINYWRALELGNPLNIEIQRLDAAAYQGETGIGSDGVWRISVLPVDFKNLAGFLKVQERYCTRVKNRATWTYPMEAKGCFNFYIDFIKNPVIP